MTFHYAPEVLDQLLIHGVRPFPGTRPALVQAFVSDLYRYELRQLKARLRRGECQQSQYYDRVVALRRTYPLVSVPVRFWTVPGTPSESDQIRLC
ncbi:MAG: hypothetical protein WCP29_11180 [Acidobacteriota bacterium]